MQKDKMCMPTPLDKMPVAMAYVPWQQWEELYNLNNGFQAGTIFPSLNKPYAEMGFCKGGRR